MLHKGMILFLSQQMLTQKRSGRASLKYFYNPPSLPWPNRTPESRRGTLKAQKSGRREPDALSGRRGRSMAEWRGSQGRRLCESSQNGPMPVLVQPQILTLRALGSSMRHGEMPVPP